jgi:predicted RNA-binding Zn ribbon-like protein
MVLPAGYISYMTSAASGILLHHPDGQTFRFDAGALCLELLVTGGEGAFSRFEVLHSPDDLVAWLPQSRLGADGWNFPDRIEVTDDELAGLKRLRAHLWQVALDLTSGRAPGQADLDAINRAAAGAPLVPQLDPDGGRGWAAPVTGARVTATMARDAVTLLGGPGVSRLRRCAGDNCALMFADTSRPGRRRWCAMERCGNRDKVRAYRDRRQHRPDDPSPSGAGR